MDDMDLEQVKRSTTLVSNFQGDIRQTFWADEVVLSFIYVVNDDPRILLKSSFESYFELPRWLVIA